VLAVSVEPGIVGYVVIMAWPIVPFTCAVAAHYLAYRRGYLIAGSLLGALLGPVGVLMALILPARQHPSARLIAAMTARAAWPNRYGLGLMLCMAGSTLLFGLSYFSLGHLAMGPIHGWSWTLSAALLVTGSAFIYAGAPPDNALPPLGDAEEYRQSDPVFATKLATLYTLDRAASRAVHSHDGYAMLAWLCIMSGLFSITFIVVPGGSHVLRLWGYGLAAVCLVSALLARHFAQLVAEARLSEQRVQREHILRRGEIDLEEQELLVQDNLDRSIATIDGAIKAYMERRVLGSLFVALPLLSIGQACVGARFGAPPVAGSEAYWFLVGVPLSALGWWFWQQSQHNHKGLAQSELASLQIKLDRHHLEHPRQSPPARLCADFELPPGEYFLPLVLRLIFLWAGGMALATGHLPLGFVLLGLLMLLVLFDHLWPRHEYDIDAVRASLMQQLQTGLAPHRPIELNMADDQDDDPDEIEAESKADLAERQPANNCFRPSERDRDDSL